MYDKTVTVFNKYVAQKKIYWYPHVIAGVDLIINKAANQAKTGLQDADTANLHVKYTTFDNVKMIGRLRWLPPKEWRSQEISQLQESLTFADGEDFFMQGEYPESVIVDADYENGIEYSGFYDFVNRQYDNVFVISNVGGPYTLIPHFEIGGR